MLWSLGWSSLCGVWYQGRREDGTPRNLLHFLSLRMLKSDEGG